MKPALVDEVVYCKIESENDFKEFINALNLKAKSFVIKPNWVEAAKGQFTEAKTLELLLKNLDGKKTIIESYTAWRNKTAFEGGKTPVNSENALEMQDFIRENDKWFLEFTGLGKIMENYNAEYLNITEECWQGRTADAEKVKEIVEGNFTPVKHEELYSKVPEKILELKGSALISFAKIKTDENRLMSLSTKNLFGCIPDPERRAYHGKGNVSLADSIADANKIYRALFDSVAINEGIFTAIEGKSPSKPELVENLGLIAGGRDFSKTDIVTAKLLGLNPKGMNYLEATAMDFGKPNFEISVGESKFRKLRLA